MSNQFIKCLLEGDPGTGKTKNMGEGCPKPALLFNFDPGGPDSIRSNSMERLSLVNFLAALKLKEQYKWKEITVLDFAGGTPVRITASKDYVKSIVLDDFIVAFNSLFDNNPFKTVILDSYSGMDACVLAWVLAKNNKGTMEIQHWGQAASKKEEIINCLLSLPCHVVVIAHVESKKDELTGEIRVLPYGSGKLQEKLASLFSQSLYATTTTDAQGKVQYVVQTQPKGLVKGIRMRFPDNKAAVCKNNWKELFE